MKYYRIDIANKDIGYTHSVYLDYKNAKRNFDRLSKQRDDLALIESHY